MIRNKVVALLLAVIFACAGFTTTASAKEVNTSLATNPTATLATIDAMNLAPLSNEKAGEVRGEGWFINMLTGAIVGTATLQAIYGSALCNSGGCSLLPWFLKPLTAY